MAASFVGELAAGRHEGNLRGLVSLFFWTATVCAFRILCQHLLHTPVPFNLKSVDPEPVDFNKVSVFRDLLVVDNRVNKM